MSCSTLSVSIRPPEGKHPSLTDDEQRLLGFLRECGYSPAYEPCLFMFRRWDSETQRFFDTGVQPDFFIPELNLYVELTRKHLLHRKLEQVELMVASGYRMLLIDRLLWEEIMSSPDLLNQLIMAAARPVSNEAVA